MLGLRAVKSKLFQTECNQCIREGLYFSEPILTEGEEGLIDNYFVYGQNREATVFSRPSTLFGVYSDLPKKAYIKEGYGFEEKEYVNDLILDREEYVQRYKLYTELYPKVRAFAYQSCNETQQEELRAYTENLKMVSGKVLWQFYRTLYPEFFEWVKQATGDDFL